MLINTFPSTVPDFRGKNKETKKWHKGSLEIHGNGVYITNLTTVKTDETPASAENEVSYDLFTSKAVKVEEDSVGIRSDFYDSNKKAVYSGDIIEFALPSNEIPHKSFRVGLVIYNGKEFLVEYHSKVAGSVALTKTYRLSELLNQYVTVIGNYYDDPSLFCSYNTTFAIETECEGRTFLSDYVDDEELAKESFMSLISSKHFGKASLSECHEKYDKVTLYKLKIRVPSEKIVEKVPVLTFEKHRN